MSPPALLAVLALLGLWPAAEPTPLPPRIPDTVLAEMSTIWLLNSGAERRRHVSPDASVIAVGQMGPLEYLGCLHGRVEGGRVVVTHWTRALLLRQRPFTVYGWCPPSPTLVGDWHTHPYRATKAGWKKNPELTQPSDFSGFEWPWFQIAVVVWDVDSLTVAVRGSDGRPVLIVPEIVTSTAPRSTASDTAPRFEEAP